MMVIFIKWVEIIKSNYNSRMIQKMEKLKGLSFKTKLG